MAYEGKRPRCAASVDYRSQPAVVRRDSSLGWPYFVFMAGKPAFLELIASAEPDASRMDGPGTAGSGWFLMKFAIWTQCIFVRLS